MSFLDNKFKVALCPQGSGTAIDAEAGVRVSFYLCRYIRSCTVRNSWKTISDMLYDLLFIYLFISARRQRMHVAKLIFILNNFAQRKKII